jgi:hypothetical protein
MIMRSGLLTFVSSRYMGFDVLAGVTIKGEDAQKAFNQYPDILTEESGVCLLDAANGFPPIYYLKLEDRKINGAGQAIRFLAGSLPVGNDRVELLNEELNSLQAVIDSFKGTPLILSDVRTEMQKNGFQYGLSYHVEDEGNYSVSPEYR